RHRLHFLEQNRKLFLVQFSVKIKTQDQIGEGDLRRHLQVLGEIIRRSKVLSLYCIVEQSAERTGAVLLNFGQLLQGCSSSITLGGIGRFNLQHRQVELGKIV